MLLSLFAWLILYSGLLSNVIVQAAVPAQENLISYVTVDENVPINTILQTFQINDTDPGDVITVFTNDPTTFNTVTISTNCSCNYVTVTVLTKTVLDREGPLGGKITLQLKAADSIGNEINIPFDLYLEDINDNSPVFNQVQYRWDIKELPGFRNETFTDIIAEDIDASTNGHITYTMKANSQSNTIAAAYDKAFGIDSANAMVSIKDKLDFETNSYYQFYVYATDGGGRNSTVDLIIRIMDVQDSPPFFTAIPYRTEIWENIPIGTDVWSVNARDGDSGVPNWLNYTILNDTDCARLFTINGITGVIQIADILDRDSGVVLDHGGICILNIKAQEIEETDAVQYGNTTAITDVTITIKDKNDNSPVFNNITYITEVPENTANNVPITLDTPSELTVHDDDQGNNAEIKLTLKNSDNSPCTDFDVLPTTIQREGSAMIRVANKSLLNYEVLHDITILIVATESSNASHVATSTVVINILDVNDNNPQFSNDSYTFYIDESSSSGTSVGVITATDADSVLFGNMSYSISGGDGRFTVDAYSGHISVLCEVCALDLDRETRDVFYMTYTATDSGGRSNSTQLVVHLKDINDKIPIIARDEYNAFIMENDSKYNVTAIIRIEATDADKPNTDNSRIMFSITDDFGSGMMSNITINQTTGELFLLSPVDYEKLTSSDGTVRLTVEATDLGANPLKNNCTVVITVQDANDNSPIFTNSSVSPTVREDARSNISHLYHIGFVNAADLDGTTVNSAFRYVIADGSFDRFGIDPSSGDVYVQRNAILDRETLDTYNLTINAIDQGSPPRNSTAIMYVTIEDVNDMPPTFNQAAYRATVTETNTNGGYVITCMATDKDMDNQLQYKIAHVSAKNEDGGDVNVTLVENYFDINGDNGTIYVSGTPDRETANVITLTIEVNDTNAVHNFPQTATVLLTITILDVNDNSPIFERTEYTVNVSESAIDDTIVETIIATDKDVNRTITYSINGSVAFSINTNTGIITKIGEIDRETDETITLTVTATDNGVPKQRTSNVSVIINVLDVNDNNPVFNVTNSVVNIPEDITTMTEVIQLRASDKDTGPNQNVTFELTGDGSDKFNIDAITGNITVSSSLDRETQQNYRLSVTAYDNPIDITLRRSAQTYVDIIIDDINDNAPLFASDLYHTTIQEDAVIGRILKRVTAEDIDEAGTNNTKISYSFLNDTTPSGLFSVDEHTGDIAINRSLKNYVDSYILAILAKDHGVVSLSNTTTVSITVTDVNLHNPVLINLPDNNTIKLYECAEVGTEVYMFNYTDGDRGMNAEGVFNISEILGQEGVLTAFKIEPNGRLRTKVTLNANIKNKYTFDVQVTDKGTPAPLPSEKTTIVIEIIDVDDHLPSFQEASKLVYVHENKTAGELVASVTAVDEDLDSIACYYIEGENSDFSIGEKNGSIVTKQVLDRETRNTYNFKVRVSDCSIKANISDYCSNETAMPGDNPRPIINVTVVVADVNDNPPTFRVYEIVTGMKRVADVDDALGIQLKSYEYVSDKDSTEHGIQAWVFHNEGDIKPSSGLKDLSMEGVSVCPGTTEKYIFCISGNGSITNNKYFSEDVSGYFLVPVKVSDGGGQSSTIVKIYLIGDSQILIMTVFGRKEMVSQNKETIMEMYSNITGYLFVYDSIEDHKTPDGQLDTLRTDLHFHVVDKQTDRVLSAAEALRLVDTFYLTLQEAASVNNVLQIVSSEKTTADEGDPTKTIYILIAVVVALCLTVIIIVYVSITTRSRYQRKLKAATIKPLDIDMVKRESTVIVPGSNQYITMSNPLLNAEIKEVDNTSLSSNNSIDTNEVDDPRLDTVYDTMEEREVTMDMYTEDTFIACQEESPLDAALKLHAMESLRNANDTNVDTFDGGVKPDHVAVGFINHAFDEDLETSEI